MSHGIYAVENDTQLARTTLMRGQMIEPRADEDIRPYGDAANE